MELEFITLNEIRQVQECLCAHSYVEMKMFNLIEIKLLERVGIGKRRNGKQWNYAIATFMS